MTCMCMDAGGVSPLATSPRLELERYYHSPSSPSNNDPNKILIEIPSGKVT